MIGLDTNVLVRYLTQDDHKARLACLEINTQSGSSQAIRDLFPYVDQHQRDIGNAVIAMRTGGLFAWR